MKSSEVKKDDVVSYYDGTENRRGSSNFRFAKVVSFGKVYATVILENGNRARIGLWKLHHAPEGREYFAPSNTACTRQGVGSARGDNNPGVTPCG